MPEDRGAGSPPPRERLHQIIFEADTFSGKLFDVALLLSILASVLAVMLESVPEVAAAHGELLRTVEWAFTILFTIEYGLRLLSVRQPLRYARSFYGVVDLLSILPTYVSLLAPGSHSLLVIRSLRLLRVFRVFKMVQFLGEANVLATAMRASGRKIIVFLGTVLTLVMILGTVMYLVEDDNLGFRSIPASVYWAIVTMTTVGYGDVVPYTDPGKAIASVVMILGYGIIAVPTGIVSVELAAAVRKTATTTQACRECLREGHDADAVFCKFCGVPLSDPSL